MLKNRVDFSQLCELLFSVPTLTGLNLPIRHVFINYL